MMFNDPHHDPAEEFGNEDKQDEAQTYGYLHEDLEPTTIEHDTRNDGPAEIPAVTTAEQVEEPPESPTSPDLGTKGNKKVPPIVDPYAEAFLQESLGPEKWNTFSARLFERRLTGPRVRIKKTLQDGQTVLETTASVIDFLCKAEAVKEVLRVYVPHPYNPHKTLSHDFPKAPSGRVTLSRSTVLALSGWSNTQFSYWARRSEAIGVLAYHDRRLRMVAHAFSNRLRGTKIRDEIAACDGVTGKGLDFIIEDVKERTGASPFIHGKHSSLDPFTIIETLPDGTPADPNAPWVDFNGSNGQASASSHYIPTTFPAEGGTAEDGSQMQYYLQNMDYSGTGLQPGSEFDIGGSGGATTTYPAGTVSPSATAKASTTPARRGRPPAGGIRAKRGSRSSAGGSKDEGGKKSPGKRKAVDESGSSKPTRKRAKTNASTDS
ncbi:hypothetical protein CPB86DRAFT_787871 [Serendipita vermifera]|nr:hypothetical protein CPB86DRAFT_787871 [Serendipita vermifera]